MWSWWLYILNYRLVLDVVMVVYFLNYRLVLDVVMVAVYSKL